MSGVEAGLEAHLRRELAGAGVIPFERFMERALYDPEFGYYESSLDQTGRAGDYYTSVGVGSLFGELLAFQFCRWLDQLNGVAADLVEAGAHDGQLAADILGWLRTAEPARFDRLTYWIVEPSPRRAAAQRARLGAFAGRVRWVSTRFPSVASAGTPPPAVGSSGVSSPAPTIWPGNRFRWPRPRFPPPSMASSIFHPSSRQCCPTALSSKSPLPLAPGGGRRPAVSPGAGC
jgi:hypothetical protein